MAEFRTVILAGERPGGSPLSRAFNVPASVMVPVAGKPALARVMEAVNNSRHAGGGLICGPSIDIVNSSQALSGLLQQPDYQWLAPAAGPAASALLAIENLDYFPTLLTAGDHALLTSEIVDDFCTRASLSDNRSKYDFVIGFVPYPLVKATWPDSRRTVLKFSNGQFCGSNLFAILSTAGLRAFSFWRQAEAERKQPWRIARRFGPAVLLRYLFRRLTLEGALKSLSTASGCRIGHVQVAFARAAVDVDSIADQRLAEKILSSENPVV